MLKHTLSLLVITILALGVVAMPRAPGGIVIVNDSLITSRQASRAQIVERRSRVNRRDSSQVSALPTAPFTCNQYPPNTRFAIQVSGGDYNGKLGKLYISDASTSRQGIDITQGAGNLYTLDANCQLHIYNVATYQPARVTGGQTDDSEINFILATQTLADSQPLRCTITSANELQCSLANDPVRRLSSTANGHLGFSSTLTAVTLKLIVL